MYYDELFVNNIRQLSGEVRGRVITDAAYLRSNRNRGPKAPFWEPVPDQTADPYAGFLRQVAENRKIGSGQYIADTGHTLTLRKAKVLNMTDIDYSTASSSKHQELRRYRPKTASSSGGLPANGNAPVQYWTNAAAFGQEAIARVAPQPSVFEGAQFLGELREGLPSLPLLALLKGRVGDIVKHAASDYVNLQFGIKPLISDCKKLFNLVLEVDSTLKQLREMQGTPQRRSFRVPVYYNSFSDTGVVGSTTNVIDWNASQFVANAVNAPSSLTAKATAGGMWGFSVSQTQSKAAYYYVESLQAERKFSGSFTSHFDYASPDASYLDKLQSLVQLDVDLATIWELTPWSWLVDWVFDIQSTITANAVAGDERVIMNFGYVTDVTIYRSFMTGSAHSFGLNGLALAPVPLRQVTEAKYLNRYRANPFGFQAASFSGFNGNQLAILAALGLSRV